MRKTLQVICRLKSLSLRETGWMLVLLGGSVTGVQAQPLPYANVGYYNNNSYTFTAVANGSVTAYIVGGMGASYTNKLGLMVNGVLTSAGFGLSNHGSTIGQSFTLGNVHAGDRLTFVMRNETLGQDLYSDASMNSSYDGVGAPGHNHIYSSAYNSGSGNYAGIPTGTYVGFEDEQLPRSNYNYNDLSFVFTNVATQVSPVSTVPEPSSYAMVMGGLAALSLLRSRRRPS